ncbi:MAG: cytochrome c3 family protein [Armatimonadota bacterium]|nr:cytochrome c3 family protein [Armatimonadota bacterium]MDR7402222.1 cytochrome c3 family protein [Armatimonadota bacterium]MDR7403350.1 cytochrome c3 family protein [Armatimonadota bacterium]MDR7436978.1 cytochrome c3 family protein [Armatimonadota bacterium]MDR7472248.1 cytochrome c3 family protein [Armatimonadota bacterium]
MGEDRPPRDRRGALRDIPGRLPRPWLAAAVVGMAAAAAALITAGYTLYDYTMNNPAFCRSCHIMEAAWDRWAASEHRAVDCHACHQQSIVESARQVIVFVVRQPQRVGRHAEVPAARCRTCHASGDPAWIQVARTAGHQVHAERRQIECVTCHSTGIHRIRAVADVCARCHEAQAVGARAVKIAQMADFHCVDCHQYLRPDSPLRPTRQTCLQCHQGLPPRRTAGFPGGAPHTGFACSTCHKPHEQARPVVTCVSCHPAPAPAVHPAAVVAAAARDFAACTSCHVPHRWTLR